MGRVFFILTTLSLILALLTNRAPSAASALLNSAESGVSLMLTNDDALEWLDGSASAHGRRGETWAAYPKIIRKTQPRASGC